MISKKNNKKRLFLGVFLLCAIILMWKIYII
nr:MAG TPA: hypothetical protein [Caudoviricetes sp.]